MKPEPIYKRFSRELLENFTYQLQLTPRIYDHSIALGAPAGGEVALNYSYECPSEEKARSLADYIHEQAEDEIEFAPDEDEPGLWRLYGQTDSFEFDLSIVMQWIGYMCDAGAENDCRFDGWVVDGIDYDSEIPEGEFSLGGLEEGGESMAFVHNIRVWIPEAVEPIARAEKYEDPLEALFEQADLLSAVDGGETLLNVDGQDSTISGVNIYIGTDDLDETITLLKQALPELGCPEGTTLHVDDQEIAVR